MAQANDLILVRLRREWLIIAIVWAAVLLAGYGLLRPVWTYADRWLILAASGLTYGLWVLWRSLPENHRPGESRLLPGLGIGNRLTLVRGLCLGLLAGFLFAPWPQGSLAWILVLLYTIVGVADYLDGYLARKANQATALGARLDIDFDGLGLLIVTLLAISFGQLPWWYLALGLARYLFLLGLWWRRRNGLPVRDIEPSVHRRIFAGFQMGFMSAVLWPIVPAAGATIAGVLFGLPVVVGFLRDWLVVSHSVDPASRRYRRLQHGLFSASTRWLPLFLRLVLLVCMWLVLRRLSSFLAPAAWTDLLHAWHLPWPGALAGLASLMAAMATLAGGAGVAGRLMAFILVFPINFDIVSKGVDWANGLALAAVISLMLLGTGHLSLWQPEDRYLFGRPDKRREQPSGG